MIDIDIDIVVKRREHYTLISDYTVHFYVKTITHAVITYSRIYNAWQYRLLYIPNSEFMVRPSFDA